MKKFTLTILAVSVMTANAETNKPLEVTVTAYRTADQAIIDSYTSSKTKLESTDTVVDAVSSTSGTTLVRSGPVGQQSSTFIRGTDSNHTLLTYNGVAIRDESTISGATDVSQHSSVGVDYVDVIKGPMGSTYGPNAVAGVINLESVVTDESYVQQSFGSNSTSITNVKVGHKFDKTTVSVEGELNSTDGISVHAGGTEKDPYKSRNYALQSSTFLDSGWEITTGYVVNNNDANLDTSSADVLNYTSNWHWENINLNATDGYKSVTYNKSTHERTYNSSGELDKYNSTTDTVLAQETYIISNGSVTVGGEVAHTSATINTTTSGWEASVDSSRTNQAIYLNSAYNLTNDVVVSGGYRYDVNNKFDDESTIRLGLGAYGFRASVSTGYRLPTFYELYGSDNYGFSGNPNVDAETSISREIGYGNEWFDVALFEIKTDNALKYTYDTNTWTSTYTNDDKTQTSRGIELTLRGEVAGVNVVNSSTIVDAKDGDNEWKSRKPRFTNTTTISKEYGAWNSYAQLNYTGKYKDIDGKTYSTFIADSVLTANIGTEYKVNETVSTFAQLNNLTDKNYERPSGYNQDGRNGMVGIKINF